MAKERTDTGHHARTSKDTQRYSPGKSEPSPAQTVAVKEKEAGDRAHVTVKAKPDPSPHKIRKP